MPVHDWTRVPAGLFHDFHQSWSIRIKDALNRGPLPAGFSVLVEQRSGVVEPDVLAIEDFDDSRQVSEGGVATLAAPRTNMVRRSDNEIYAGRANQIVIRHHLGRIVAIIEIVSPGNKDSRAAMADFVRKTINFLRGGVHVLVVDLFPPTLRDPFGIHKAIWDEINEEDFAFPVGKNRILVSYETGPERVAYLEPIAVGDPQPDMPLFLAAGFHVSTPLESTYQSAWDSEPPPFRRAVETGVLPQAKN